MWWSRNWKWIVPISGLILIVAFFFSAGMNGVATDLVQAYVDTELYDKALAKVEADVRAKELLGEIQPIGKLAILEGYVEYTNNNGTVNSSVRILGTKGKASMDISADRIDNAWEYTKINIRIKNPPEKKQIIEIYRPE
jgi:hypothetical protein